LADEAAETEFTETRRYLDVSVEAAWQTLTCRAGARRWFDDPGHEGIRVGAQVPLWNSLPAEITAVEHGSFRIALPTGRGASIEFR